jgi:hypothetical protein
LGPVPKKIGECRRAALAEVGCTDDHGDHWSQYNPVVTKYTSRAGRETARAGGKEMGEIEASGNLGQKGILEWQTHRSSWSIGS